MFQKILTITALGALISFSASADEGMWMVNAISRALVQNMQREGFRLPGKAIYDEQSVSLKDAIVSLDFGCTGSMISPEGLLITNHHCAYSDVHALSTPEHNYLEEGFWARSRAEEMPVKGKTAYFLRKVIDVTEEVAALEQELKTAGKPFGMRKLSYVLEKRYSESEGAEASLSSMWAGEKYYMAIYDTCTDVRLVAAPPVSIAAFGGDTDNWEWPQQKCDFALYRLYKDGQPYQPRKYLKISRKGYGKGDFSMVLGYPGRTDRYASAAKVRFMTEVSLPIVTEVRGTQMEILRRRMDADPAVRRLYSERFFMLSNVQELQAGQAACSRRFGVAQQKAAEEKALGIATPLLDSLDASYRAVEKAECNRIYYRETLVRGTRLGLIATRLNSLSKSRGADKKEQIAAQVEKEFATLDLATETELLRYSLRTYYTHVDSSLWGPYQKQLYRDWNGDTDAICDAIAPKGLPEAEDPLCRFFGDVGIVDFNKQVDSVLGGASLRELGRRYTRAVYEARDRQLQYPDANSTMRLTYGTVKGYSPKDALFGHWQSHSTGILEKADPSHYDFTLKPEWEALLRSSTDIPPVNFLTDNDITGGNSGSPVLNAKGEIIGLAFDGNKESLASDWSFTPGYNRCVCVDIRFVLWTLRHYARLDGILSELGI